MKILKQVVTPANISENSMEINRGCSYQSKY